MYLVPTQMAGRCGSPPVFSPFLQEGPLAQVADRGPLSAAGYIDETVPVKDPASAGKVKRNQKDNLTLATALHVHTHKCAHLTTYTHLNT